MGRLFCIYCEEFVMPNTKLIRIKKCYLRKRVRSSIIFCCSKCYRYHEMRKIWYKQQQMARERAQYRYNLYLKNNVIHHSVSEN